ncbi:MAG: DUF512 domain-containing protein [Oscillospiraceae bacterium]|nr:DUF512 domain-containing protein [Oscillospiraceae bacterium]
MNAIVKSIVPGSPASGTIIAPGDALRKINGGIVGDVLDYKFSSYDDHLMLELLSPEGKLKLVRIRKLEGVDLGLDFESYLMDKEQSCSNRCIFCFIDQNPTGMRKTLYYKDDDMRLSFLQGNYISLTNLSDRDVGRIISLRISPINVSVHTLDPELRSFMLGNERGGSSINALKELASSGIMLNCQIVCCPGVNDEKRLQETIEGLIALGPGINSVSVVPVGLTSHREGLAPLRPVDRRLALKIVRLVGRYGELCLRKRGSRVFFCADELYLKAGLRLPEDEFYEEYPQLENGVGMMRLFITEFEQALEELGGAGQMEGFAQGSSFSVATGVAAHKYLTKLLKTASEKYGRMCGNIYSIKNDFFGHSVTVSGLVTGRDLIGQLKGRKLGSRLLIPQNMLRHKEDVFLDDVTVADVSNALGVTVRVVGQDGADLLQAFLGS